MAGSDPGPGGPRDERKTVAMSAAPSAAQEHLRKEAAAEAARLLAEKEAAAEAARLRREEERCLGVARQSRMNTPGAANTLEWSQHTFLLARAIDRLLRRFVVWFAMIAVACFLLAIFMLHRANGSLAAVEGEVHDLKRRAYLHCKKESMKDDGSFDLSQCESHFEPETCEPPKSGGSAPEAAPTAPANKPAETIPPAGSLPGGVTGNVAPGG